MADIITPDALNERFTLYLNAASKPVQRPLREMTTGEVLLAVEWQTAEANRLQAEAEPWAQIGELIEAGRMDEVPDLPSDEFRAAGERCNESANAFARVRRLRQLIHAAMPQYRGSGIPLEKALRRWWPHRQNAA